MCIRDRYQRRVHGHQATLFQRPIDPDVAFVLEETELIGIATLLLSVLLADGGHQPNIKPPQTVLALATVAIKFVNNLCRVDPRLVQRILGADAFVDQVYHLFNFLVCYARDHFDAGGSNVQSLLNETLLLIGFFALENERHQEVLARGTPPLLRKLATVPWAYFSDEKLQDVLFPALICCVAFNQRNLNILSEELNPEILKDYIVAQMKMKGDSGSRRSLSISSTHSSQNSFVHASSANNFAFSRRFPAERWREVLDFIDSMCKKNA
eukprot:TRINITY_DN4795_c0_g3_i1.p1 TRINITY_DN4795_c0_g3~~TRINITY_DN4795_c0_g3_i1.p1  ORF type:complete len:268 (+),score=52.50 TRINITY_DN4795_c0_g3_i1:67-870(+)